MMFMISCCLSSVQGFCVLASQFLSVCLCPYLSVLRVLMTDLQTDRLYSRYCKVLVSIICQKLFDQGVMWVIDVVDIDL